MTHNLMPPRIGRGLTFLKWVFEAVAVKYRLEPFLDILRRFILVSFVRESTEIAVIPRISREVPDVD